MHPSVSMDRNKEGLIFARTVRQERWLKQGGRVLLTGHPESTLVSVYFCALQTAGERFPADRPPDFAHNWLNESAY